MIKIYLERYSHANEVLFTWQFPLFNLTSLTTSLLLLLLQSLHSPSALSTYNLLANTNTNTNTNLLPCARSHEQ